MKKRITLFTTSVLCVASIAVGAVAASVIKEIKAELRPDFTVVVDGETKDFKNVKGDKVYPILYDGTTYLPLRAIGELMGKTVYWYEDEKKIELKEEKTTVTDADVIIGGADAPTNIVVTDKKDKEKDINKAVDTTEFIGIDEAKEIALEKAGLKADEVIFDRVELDKDNGVWKYEVEFKKGLIEYDAEIKAIDGTVLSFEKDIDD